MRAKLPDRRPNTTVKILWAQSSGAQRDVLITVGWDEQALRSTAEP